MIVVTGGAGFIGSNLVHALAARGVEVIVVDDLTDGTKYANLIGAAVHDFIDKDRFLEMVRTRDSAIDGIEAVFHQGACSSTTEWNGRYMMETNFEYSKRLLECCRDRRTPLIYASSAAVYGGNKRFSEERENESPLNVYGYSKLLFDEIARRAMRAGGPQIVGLRYFNVYGPREAHKGPMASVAFHFWKQVHETGRLRLFQGTDGFADGEQRRDFVYVGDVVATNLWFLEHPSVSGVYNVGTGRSEAFNEVARSIVRCSGRGTTEYIPFPESLRGRYQSFTEADLTRLRSAGCDVNFRPVAEGVRAYADWLSSAR